MEPREQFGANLRRARLAADLTQERLGELASVHPTEISRLERARRDPQLSTILRIARALEIAPGDLLAGIR